MNSKAEVDTNFVYVVFRYNVVWSSTQAQDVKIYKFSQEAFDNLFAGNENHLGNGNALDFYKNNFDEMIENIKEYIINDILDKASLPFNFFDIKQNSTVDICPILYTVQ